MLYEVTHTHNVAQWPLMSNERKAMLKQLVIIDKFNINASAP